MKKGDRPLWWLTVTILAGILTLLGGLWYHQVYASSQYVESQKTQSFRRVRYPALRGKITDRNGIALAENRACYNVNLYLEELSGRFQEAWRVAKTQADRERARAVEDKRNTNSPPLGWFQRLFRKAKGGKPKLTPEESAALQKQVRYGVFTNLVFELGKRMGQSLTPADEKRFQDHYAGRLVVPLPVMEDLNAQQVALFYEMPNKPPGLNLDLQPLRRYPGKTEASHLLGFLQRSDKLKDPEDPDLDLEASLPGLPDYEGKVGLEGAFDDDLRGRSGIRLVMVNNLGYRQSETNLVPADPGSNIVTTIDMRLQRVAEEAFRQSGATKGAVVVMDPHNGDVLALVSYPPFDPNVFIPRVSSEEWNKLNDTNVNTMLNRATFGEYTPGSIFKIVVGLACLESGLDPAELFQTKGYYQHTPHSPRIGDKAKPGKYDFRLALAKSSNEYFIANGVKAGLEPIMEMGHQFFLGEKTQMPLLQEETGVIPSDAWLKKMKAHGTPFQPGDLWYLCIGQGYITVTPIQMAVMTSAVANGGKVLWPRLIQRIEQQTAAPEKSVRIFAPVRVRGELNVNPVHLQIVREGMLADVEDNEGTGKFARVAGMKIAGKTGTAEIKPGHERRNSQNTWFISFGPYDDPRFVVVVLADEGGRSGGGTCAPVARRIYEAIQKLEAKG